jgi:putative hydrolase of the HAD superfamily
VNIEAILLDFGGTLDSNGADWYEQFYEIASLQGMRLDWNAFQESARKAGKNIYGHPDIGRLSHPGTVQRLMAEIRALLPADVLMDPVSAAESFLGLCQPWLERHVEVVQRLSERFRLGVLSNNWGNAEGWCREYGYLPYLETVVDSGLVKISKPEPGIFRIALEKLGLPPASVVYVGDKYHTDMVGAKGAGLKTVWVRHPKVKDQPTDGVVDFVISALPEVLDISRNWNSQRGKP